jgi:hypothetical protein
MNRVPELPSRAVRAIRLRSQRLDDAARSTPQPVAAIVRAVGGVQAQDLRAATLGVRVRGHGISTDDVDRARGTDPSIVRAWCMRGTLHLVPTDLLPSLLAVFGPVYVPRGRRRLAQLGLDDDACRRGVAVIQQVLEQRGPMTRNDIAAALRARGVIGDPHDRATIHLIRRACLEGIACDAGSPGADTSYALRATWLPSAPIPERASALGEIARWYVAAYEPTSQEDFAAWSGLPVSDVRTAWERVGTLVATGDGAQRLWLRTEAREITETAPGSPAVRLLPAFDNYLLGYRDRRHAVASEDATRIHPGGGIIRPTVLVDGRVAGIWRIGRSSSQARLAVESFADLDRAHVRALEAEVDDVGRFLRQDLILTMTG